MILQLDNNMLMLLEFLQSLITYFFFNTEVSCLYLVSCLLLRCVCCFMYSAMYAVMLYDVILSINVNMLEVASIWVVCSCLYIQNLADQVKTALLDTINPYQQKPEKASKISSKMAKPGKVCA